MDNVNNPKHYSHQSGVECIEISQHFDFCIGNAIKYMWRYNDKDNPLQDLKKSIWYIKKRIDMCMNGEIPMFPVGSKKYEIQTLCKKYYESEKDELVRDAVRLLIMHKWSISPLDDLYYVVGLIEQKIKILEGRADE